VSKQTVTKLFVGGIVAFVAGLIVAIFGVWGAFAGGALQMNGPDVVGINATPFTSLMVVLMVSGGLAMIGGGIAGFVSWIGALINTAELADKTWFLLLLLLGIFNFGFIAMIVYLMAGPDGTAEARQRLAHA